MCLYWHVRRGPTDHTVQSMIPESSLVSEFILEHFADRTDLHHPKDGLIWRVETVVSSSALRPCLGFKDATSRPSQHMEICIEDDSSIGGGGGWRGRWCEGPRMQRQCSSTDTRHRLVGGSRPCKVVPQDWLGCTPQTSTGLSGPVSQERSKQPGGTAPEQRIEMHLAARTVTMGHTASRRSVVMVGNWVGERREVVVARPSAPLLRLFRRAEQNRLGTLPILKSSYTSMSKAFCPARIWSQRPSSNQPYITVNVFESQRFCLIEAYITFRGLQSPGTRRVWTGSAFGVAGGKRFVHYE